MGKNEQKENELNTITCRTTFKALTGSFRHWGIIIRSWISWLQSGYNACDSVIFHYLRVPQQILKEALPWTFLCAKMMETEEAIRVLFWKAHHADYCVTSCGRIEQNHHWRCDKIISIAQQNLHPYTAVIGYDGRDCGSEWPPCCPTVQPFPWSAYGHVVLSSAARYRHIASREIMVLG
jgi:hypothetical protein